MGLQHQKQRQDYNKQGDKKARQSIKDSGPGTVIVHVLVLPVFTVALQFVNVAEGGFQDDQDREEADKANDCGEGVDSGEVGPGFHEKGGG